MTNEELDEFQHFLDNADKLREGVVKIVSGESISGRISQLNWLLQYLRVAHHEYDVSGSRATLKELEWIQGIVNDWLNNSMNRSG